MEHLDIKGLTNYQATLGEQLARQVTYILLIYVNTVLENTNVAQVYLLVFTVGKLIR